MSEKIELLWSDFCDRRQSYLRLRGEIADLLAERAKLRKSIPLMGQLLELEGVKSEYRIAEETRTH